MRGAQVESDIAEASVLDVQPQRHVRFVEPLENFGADGVEPQLDSRVLPAKREGGKIDAEIRERIDPVPQVHAAVSRRLEEPARPILSDAFELEGPQDALTVTSFVRVEDELNSAAE